MRRLGKDEVDISMDKEKDLVYLFV